MRNIVLGIGPRRTKRPLILSSATPPSVLESPIPTVAARPNIASERDQRGCEHHPRRRVSTVLDGSCRTTDARRAMGRMQENGSITRISTGEKGDSSREVGVVGATSSSRENQLRFTNATITRGKGPGRRGHHGGERAGHDRTSVVHQPIGLRGSRSWINPAPGAETGWSGAASGCGPDQHRRREVGIDQIRWAHAELAAADSDLDQP